MVRGDGGWAYQMQEQHEWLFCVVGVCASVLAKCWTSAGGKHGVGAMQWSKLIVAMCVR